MIQSDLEQLLSNIERIAKSCGLSVKSDKFDHVKSFFLVTFASFLHDVDISFVHDELFVYQTTSPRKDIPSFATPSIDQILQNTKNTKFDMFQIPKVVD